MHKVAHNTAHPPKAGASSRRKPALIAGAALAGVLAIAWFDGGEEPLHEISQPVETPVGGAG